MGLFRYEAVDKTGKTVRGVMDASDEQQVAQKLGNMGYTPQSVFSAHGQPPAQNVTGQQQPANVPQQAIPRPKGGIETVTIASGIPISVKSKVPASALATFFRQLATLVRSGRPLYQSLTDIRVSNSKIRALLPTLQDRISQGQKLSGAMAEYPKIFPVHAIASVWCGELAGKLDIVLDEIATDFEREASDTRFGRVGWFFVKITVILFILMAPFLNLNSLITKVAGQGVNFAVKTLADGFYAALPFIFATLISWEVWGVIKRVPIVRHILDGILIRTPVWGKIHRATSMSRFLHMMDSMVSAGIYPETAWDAASLTPRNTEIAKRLRLARNASPPGSNIAVLLENARFFGVDDVGLLVAGEKSGQLPEVMMNLSESYSQKANTYKTMGKGTSVILIMVFQGVLTVVAAYLMIKGYADYFKPMLNSVMP